MRLRSVYRELHADHETDMKGAADKIEKEDLKNSGPPCIIYLEVIKRH